MVLWVQVAVLAVVPSVKEVVVVKVRQVEEAAEERVEEQGIQGRLVL